MLPSIRVAVAAALVGLTATIARAADVQTPAIFDTAAAPADAIADYAVLVIGICLAIFVVVATLLAIAVVRFRAREGETREPPQVYGSNQIELAWTVVPVLIVVILGLVTARNIVALQDVGPEEGVLRVRAVGHQWWWEFHYPDHGVVTANELHLPVGTRAVLDLESADVIHSFWVPQLAGKIDLIPNRTNHLWMEPARPGHFVGQCAEYCGTQHAHMLLSVVVQSPDDFEGWIANQQRDAVDDPAVREGREIFERTACVSCHVVRGTPADGRFGPDLTHLMSRATIGSGVAPNGRDELIAWITSPDHLKPGVRMPAMNLDEPSIEKLVDYLVTLR